MPLKPNLSPITKALPVVVALVIGFIAHQIFGGSDIVEASGSYACPMLCVVLDSPGICPVCGMDLEQLVETGDTLIVSDVGYALAELSSVEVKEVSLSISHRFPAQVVYKSESTVLVTTWADGVITDLRITGVGEQVERGQILAVTHSPQVQSAQADYIAALQSEDSYLINSATLRLEELGSYPTPTLESSTVSYIRSPVSGTVGSILRNSGAWLTRGEPIATVIDNSGKELQISVSATFNNELEIGLPVSLGNSGGNWVGFISRIETEIDSNTQTLSAYVSLPDSISLTPGMFTTVKVNFNSVETPSLAIPAQSVLTMGERSIVYVDLGRGKFVPRVIELGSAGFNDDGTSCFYVTSGLNPGEKVVLDGVFLLDSQAELTGITSLMNDTGNL